MAAQRFSRHRDSYFNGATLRILRHEETETALRNLLHEERRKKIEFKLFFLYISIEKCAVLSFPFKHDLQEDSKRSKKLLDALRTVQKDVSYISSIRLGVEAGDQFVEMFEKVLQFTEEYTRKNRGAPTANEMYLCAAALHRYFTTTFGAPVLPAIDALLTATFGPHDAISRIMKKSEHIFD